MPKLVLVLAVVYVLYRLATSPGFGPNLRTGAIFEKADE